MDNYQLNEEIGKGSFSTAYKGRRRRTTNFYAILSTDKCRRMRVLNSVHILRAVQHHCVIKFYNWFETNNHLWVITEFCSGGDLCSILKDTVMSETSLRVLGRDIATGLMHFHSLGYLYNDLKPDNLLMDSIPSLRFYDFGNSCPITLATQRNLVGTPAYLAPEFFLPNQGVVSMAADLWSLGCVLFEMASGAPPFTGNDLPSLLRNILTQPTPRVEKLSNEFNTLLMGLLEKDPRKRYTWSDVAASEFWEELLAIPINGFPPEPAFAEYVSQPARVYADEQLNSSIDAAVTAAFANITPQSRKSEETLKSKNIAQEELDFTPIPTAVSQVVAPERKRRSLDTKVAPGPSGVVNPVAVKQPQLSKTDRAAAAVKAKEPAAQLANPERSGSSDFERDKAATRMEVEEVCLDASVSVDIRACIWHHSDTHIRPLCMNARIERYIEPPLRREMLPFPYHSLEELKVLGHDGITAFMRNAYRMLSSERQPDNRLNLLAYFEIICKDASIANILINGATLDFCFRLLEDSSTPHELRAEAAMIIGQLVRHTTFIHQDVVRAGIIQRAMNLFGREGDHIVRRRLLVCLGELLFYVAAQTAEAREGWGIQADAIQQLYVSALESEDDILRHYAIKGIENVSSLADRSMADSLFATTDIVDRLISIYRGGQGTQSKGEHMRSSAICAVCKLSNASDSLLQTILQSNVFPVSEYPSAIKRSHIPLTGQLLLTLLVSGLYRAMDLVKNKESAVHGKTISSPETLIHLVAGVSGRVLDSVRELNDKSTTAMRGKCLLLLCLLTNLGGSTLAQICTPQFPAFLDRLVVDKDSYIQKCLVLFNQSLNLYIVDKLRSLKEEVTSPLYLRTLRHLLSSSVVRRTLELDVEAFQFLGECVQRCLTSSSHNSYEDEFHSVVERFLAPEFVQTKLHAICVSLIPPLQSMFQVKNNASHFFAVRLLYTFVSSLLIEYPNTAAPPQEAVTVVRNAVANMAAALPVLLQESQPVPSYTFRLLTACGEWNVSTLEPIFVEDCAWQIMPYLSASNNSDQMRPLQLLYMMLTQRKELIKYAFEHGFHTSLYTIISQALHGNSAENIVETACSVAAALFTVQLDEATLAVVRQRVPVPELEMFIRLLLGICSEDGVSARYASGAIEGIVRVSPEAQQTVLGAAGMEVLIPVCKRGPTSEHRQESLQSLLRAMRYAAKEGGAYPALGQEASLLLALHNTQVQGWASTVTDEATKFLHEIEESTTFSYPTPVH